MGGEWKEKEIREWRRDRDNAVASLDVERFRAFYQKWTERGYYTAPLPDDVRTVEITLYKMAASLTGIPTSRREEAKDWLRHHGFKEGF